MRATQCRVRPAAAYALFLSLALLQACTRDVQPTRETLPRGPIAEQVPDEKDELIAVTAPNNTVRPAKREFDDSLLAHLRVPAGFSVGVFARDLVQPRGMIAARDVGLYVAEREAGRVTLLEDRDGDGQAEARRVVATGLGEGLQGVHDLALRDDRLYMVTETELFVADVLENGDLGEPRRLADDIPAGGQHPNRTIAFSPEGELFLSIGSTCNACVEPKEEHATLTIVDLEDGSRTLYAEGLRNTVGFAWHPLTGQLFGLDHNSDGRGDDWPPEELNRIERGRHYGWPFCGGMREPDWHVPDDPEAAPRREFCARTAPPVLTYQAHAAPMQLVYYTARAFPEAYRNDAFATMRGSWNRNPPVGYEVVRIEHDDEGNPTAIEPFVTGWLIEGGSAFFGRLMGIAVAGDGALLVGDDENGVIYRIAHR
jgi:glucose/arabinose dehydrogenase